MLYFFKRETYLIRITIGLVIVRSVAALGHDAHTCEFLGCDVICSFESCDAIPWMHANMELKIE